MPALDRSVPALIAKIGRYPLHHGGVGAIRSLGRAGVPVYAVTEGRWTPAAVSGYLQGRFVWPTTGLEPSAWLAEGLFDIGRRIGRPTVLIPTDDEAAIVIAEHASQLSEIFLLPKIDPTLPRMLADKRQLHDICVQHGVDTPGIASPTNPAELKQFSSQASFPVVVKNPQSFERLRTPVVGGSTVIDDAEQLEEISRTWSHHFNVLIQEYLPVQDAEDWIVHAYCDESSSPLVQFTGVKVRSYPPHSGVTTCAYSVHNPVLADIAARFVKSIGFRGILDLDWRYDRRSGRYNLLDFNPRVGAQFRLFETDAGIDVVRALHLDMTGREVPPGGQIEGRRFLVENFDLISSLAARRGYTTPSVPARPSSTELAWFAADDKRPAVAMVAGFLAMAARRIWTLLRRSR